MSCPSSEEETFLPNQKINPANQDLGDEDFLHKLKLTVGVNGNFNCDVATTEKKQGTGLQWKVCIQ